MGDPRWSRGDWVVRGSGWVPSELYYNGDEVFDEPMRGYTPLPKEKGREYIVARVAMPQVYKT